MAQLEVEEIAKAIGIPTEAWHGQCYGIATAISKTGIVEGAKPIYGAYFGPVNPDGFWADRAVLVDTVGINHGWLITPDRAIIDPTRWSFEGCAAYIAEFSPDSPQYVEYDAGSNHRRKLFQRPCPAAETDRLVALQADVDTKAVIDGLIEVQPGGQYALNQTFWLANLVPDMFGGRVTEVYDAIIEAGHAALVPFDNRLAHATPKEA